MGRASQYNFIKPGIWHLLSNSEIIRNNQKCYGKSLVTHYETWQRFNWISLEKCWKILGNVGNVGKCWPFTISLDMARSISHWASGSTRATALEFHLKRITDVAIQYDNTKNVIAMCKSNCQSKRVSCSKLIFHICS